MTATNRHLSGRKYFMHPAHTTIGVSASLAAMRAQRHDDAFAEEREDLALRVCVIAGPPLDGSEQPLVAVQAHLEEHFHVRCTHWPCMTGDLFGLEDLKECDCAVVYARRLMISGEPLRQIEEYCRRGRPLVVLRATGQAFQNWPGFEREVLGADFHGDFGEGPTEVQIAATANGHPVVRGVAPFTSRSGLCKIVELADDATVLLHGTIDEHTHPLAWVRTNRGGRVFCTSLGHLHDFETAGFLRLLANAIAWATRTAAR